MLHGPPACLNISVSQSQLFNRVSVLWPTMQRLFSTALNKNSETAFKKKKKICEYVNFCISKCTVPVLGGKKQLSCTDEIRESDRPYSQPVSIPEQVVATC